MEGRLMSAQRGLGGWMGGFGFVLVAGLLFGAPARAQNVAPTISGTPPATAVVGQAYSFRPTAMDANGDRLSFSASGVPGWAKFDRKTGRLYGTPSKRHVGKVHSILVSVTDGKLRTSLPTFTITVAATATATITDAPPTIGGTPASSVVEGELYGFVPTASDPEGASLSFSISGKPSWATFTTSSGLLSGIPPAGSAGPYSQIRISVSDGKNTATLPTFSITVNPKPNSPPSIWGIPETSVNSGEAYSFRPSASDPEGQKLSFSVAGLPGWARFDGATGAVSGTPTFANAGTHGSIVISVSDGAASASLAPFAITVVGVNTPPTISGSPSGSVKAGQAYGFAPVASDPDGQKLTFSVAGKPAWASFDVATGRFSGTPTGADVGTHSGISISVSDGVASAALPPFSITVDAVNTPPTISGTPPESVTAGQAYAFTPYASDLENQSLTFSITGKPSWASFDTTTGRLAGTPTATDVGTLSGVTISVSDGQASTSLPAFSVTVLAATPGSATVSWTPPTSFEDGTPIANLAGYRVVYGQVASALSEALTIPSAVITSATVEGLAPGTWYFAVKAYTTANVESNLSSIASKTIK
jgi:nitrite reductase/ring-hydroxylating ferredoxin subunit